MLLASSLSAAPRAAPLPGYAAVQNSGHDDYAATWDHPFAHYAAPLSTFVLIVMSAIALLALLKFASNRLSFGAAAKNVGNLYFIKSGSRGYTISRRQMRHASLKQGSLRSGPVSQT